MSCTTLFRISRKAPLPRIQMPAGKAAETPPANVLTGTLREVSFRGRYRRVDAALEPRTRLSRADPAGEGLFAHNAAAGAVPHLARVHGCCRHFGPTDLQMPTQTGFCPKKAGSRCSATAIRARRSSAW